MVETRADESAGWRGIFSLRIWWSHLVWLVLAAAAGGGALYFIYAERWSIDFIKRVTAISPALQALNVAIGMIIICRLRDRVFPGTEGTGIPQAMAALDLGEGAARSRLLSLRIAVGKIVLLTLALFSGATIGREGPSVHVAACFLYLGRRLATFRPHLIERGLIVAGGAAGIGAAFNAPIAGILFAFEEIGRGFDKRNSGIVVRTVVVACLVCVAVLSNYRVYGLVDAEFHRWRDWLGMPIAIGLAGGLLGGVFARIVAETTPRVAHLARHRPYAVAGSLGLSLAVLGLISDGASYGGGDQQAHAILIQGQSLPAYYPLVKALGSLLTLISSIPGGLFTPSLSVGAGLGQLAAEWVPDMNRQAIVLLAMAAYFSGVVQSPLTAAVIVIEMTSARLMTLPLLFATVTAYETSRLVCPVSLYEALAQSFVRRLEPPPLSQQVVLHRGDAEGRRSPP